MQPIVDVGGWSRPSSAASARDVSSGQLSRKSGHSKVMSASTSLISTVDGRETPSGRFSNDRTLLKILFINLIRLIDLELIIKRANATVISYIIQLAEL